MAKKLSLGWLILITMGCAAATHSGTAARSMEPSAIIGPVWQWIDAETAAEKIKVNSPERYTMQLGADGRAKILFDCNRGGGDYRIGNGTLSFGPLIATRMACPPDTQDAPFMKGLTDASSFFVENRQLTLGLKNGGTMTFRLAP